LKISAASPHNMESALNTTYKVSAYTNLLI